MDYCTAGPQFASGGFIADSAFTGSTVINGSQQQFIVRNSNLDGWTNGVWNQVFAGDHRAHRRRASRPRRACPAAPRRTPRSTPARRRRRSRSCRWTRPGKYSVFVPALQHDTVGPSWAGRQHGRHVAADQQVLHRHAEHVGRWPSTLRSPLGKNLLLTPGVYNLTAPILVSRPDTIVLGLGFPTLVPQHGTAALRSLDVPGVKLSGFIVDAGPKNSPVLLQVGTGLRPPVGHGRRPDARAGRVLPDRRRHRRHGDHQPRRQQLRRDPRRHLGLAGRPRRGRRRGPATPPTPA